MYKDLAASIIIRAIEDYNELKKYNVKRLVMEDGNYIYMEELKDFFNSEWCNILLSHLSTMTGKELLNILEKS